MKKKVFKRTGAMLLALSLAWGSLSGIAHAETATKPENGMTEGQPFRPGTGGSQNFRIPCMVTLKDGTVVAACDARWNHASDACGLDTIVSYSKDNGETWNYSFANYLGDNGNKFHIQSTAFIDPAITTDGENVYMIADLYPAGIAINTTPDSHRPKTGHTGFNEKDQLVLAKATESVTGTSPSADRIGQKFDYYLEKNTDANAESYYLLKDKNNNIVKDYTIDAYFNIKGENVDTNLFCGDSPYFPWPTDYLYMTKSSDGGASWSEPMLLNLKKAEEQTLLVGPGRGITTSSGRILFTCYEFTNGDKNSACIYSDDGGKTWQRGSSVKGWSSEAVVTEADGKIYMFTRHGRAYYVSEDMGSTWSEQKSTGLTYNENCQLSAITYSQKIDGKTAILFSAPSNSSSRSAGKIYVALVQEDGSLTWPYEYAVNGDAYYAYSCLSELKDHSVGLLYESAGSAITYKKFDIREVAKGAAIGNIWCTDQNGNGVSDIELKSNTTVSYNVNGVNDGELVEVESSDPESVTAEYENGQLTIKSNAVAGLKRAVVTVKTEHGFTEIHVTITDSENYKIVDLRIGDSKTFLDDSGNYSNQDVGELDSSVAEITMDGQDPSALITQVNARSATAIAQFNGAEQPLEQCLFTFAKAENSENTYQISANVGGEKVYLSNKQSNKGTIPCIKTATNIQLEEKGNSIFALKDLYIGNSNGAYLYFHKETDKLYFNRNSSYDSGHCGFAIFEKSASALDDSEIYGYTKLSSTSEIQSGGQYLITYKAADDQYYVLKPSTGANEYDYVAKVVSRQVEDTAVLAVQLGSNVNFDGEKRKISDCEFTFSKQENGKYHIRGLTTAQQNVYLNLQTSGDKPNKTTASDIEIIKDADGNTFKLKDINADGGRHLHFWSDTSKLYYDRCKDACTNGNDSFELFIRDDSAEASAPISGYRNITDVSEIDSASGVLIARKVGETYYIMNPSNGTDKYNYVAKVTNEIFETPKNNGWTEITFKAIGEGSTSVTIGNVTYYLFVQNDVKHISLKVGDTYTIPGVVSDLSEAESLFSIDRKDTFPPYESISEFKEGKYLFGQDSHIMINQPSTASGTEKGLGMQAVDLETKDYTDYLWTIETYENGYVMKSSDGKYVNITGANVELKDTPQELKIVQKSNGGFSVSDGNGRYLNNWGKENNKVAAYTADDNTWRFYKSSTSYILTAKTTGEITLVGNNGRNYHITVTCDHLFSDWEVTKKPTATLEGEKERKCEICGKIEKEILPPLGTPIDPDENENNQSGSGDIADTENSKKPAKPENKTEGAVKTGDSTNMPIFFAMALLSASVILVKKRQK